MNAMTGAGTPKFLAFFAAFCEFFGGVGLILGLLTRLSALGIFFVMAIATFKVNWPNGFFMNWYGVPNQGHGIEYSMTLLAAALSLMLTGCGKLGIDNLIWRRKSTL